MADKADNRVVFEGLCKWATLPPRPARKGYETEDTAYQVLIECSKDKFKKLQAAGIPALTKLREEDDGKTYISLKATKTKGDMVFNDIPVIDEYGDPVTENIGNGSTLKCIAALEDIKGKKGKALRLKGVVLINLVPYADNVFGGIVDLKPHEQTGGENDDPVDLFS